MYDRIFFCSAQNVTDVSFFVVEGVLHEGFCLFQGLLAGVSEWL